MSIRETAEKFFHACEAGKGWTECRQYCTPDATFSAQADMLTAVQALEHYTNWMQGLYQAFPDASYELKAFGVDDDTGKVLAFGVFRGTHTGEGGPVAPTGRRVEADYVYIMEFDLHNGRIKHMTKVWNDAFSAAQVGWG